MKHTRLVVLLAGMILTACSAAVAPTAHTAESRIYESRSGRDITLSALAKEVSSADVVFFGEQHDDPATHRAELALLAAIGARNPNVIVSLEMFERDVQPALDAYMSGMLPESVFVATSRPWPRYTTDYRALVELARAHGWPVVASNVPRSIASAIGRTGLAMLDTMQAGTRVFAARELSCPHDAYYTRFAEAMQGHTPGDANAVLATTNRFYEAQCVKDETMAESIVAALERAGTGAIVVHFNGAFHSNMGLGTAERVRRRVPGATMVVITAVPVDDVARADATSHAALGDYIILTPRPVRSATGR